MNFAQKIMDDFQSLTYSQKNIANYLLEHLDQIALCTLEELSGRIGVSTTTVIRFAKTFGYSGYSDMQQDILNSATNKAALPERALNPENIPDDQLLQDTFQNDIHNIQTTLAAQNTNDLTAAVRLISEAETVYILGMRSSYASAYYLASRLGEIKENVRFIQSTGMMYPEEIVGACEKDVLIAYLFPRYSRVAATMTSWMKAHGTKVIMITSTIESPIRGYGDIILPCAVNSISYKNSFAAPLCLTNYLVSAVSKQNPEETVNILKKTEEILDQGYYLGL